MTFYLRATTVVLAALDLLVLALVSVRRPDVDPVTGPAGADAPGGHSVLLLFATAGVGLAAVALAVLVRPLVTGKVAPIGVGLLVFFGVARVMQAFFPIGTGPAVTTTELVHTTLGTIAFLILPIAALGVAVGLRSRWSIGFAAALAVALVLVLAGAGGPGPVQWLFLALGSGWLLVTALTASGSHPAAG